MWDYHVVVLVWRDGAAVHGGSGAGGWWVWDLDTRLPLPCPAGDYLRASFRHVGLAPDELAPCFRVVEARTFAATFTTDRSHMRVRGRWRAPPPTWPPPAATGHPMNLMRFVDPHDDIAGEVLALAQMLQRYAGELRGAPG